MDSERYDIAATMPPTTPDDQVLLMLQALLVERFQLKLHWEEKEMVVHALVAGKNGPKLKKTADETRIPDVRLGPFSIDARNKSMEDLAGILMRWTDRPVVDMTGLSGAYDFKLDWSADRSQPSGGIPEGMAMPVTEDPLAPLRALASLGLKAEVRRVPLKFLVIDHAEKVPTEN
jgi:uncharacterized protein (TIGR03435 family)